MRRTLLLLPLLIGCAYYRLEFTKENLAKADVIVVPGYELTDEGRGSWLLWNRVLMGRILMERGYSKRLLFSGGKPKAGVTEAARMLEIAGELGIPRDRILLEETAASSVENGRRSAALIAERGWRSGLVVSDPRHLRYAIPVFRDAFVEKGLALYWTPVDYDLLEQHPEARRPPG
jgi:uncharacterized SAM-binding protein YcdF (DUF218 family)